MLSQGAKQMISKAIRQMICSVPSDLGYEISAISLKDPSYWRSNVAVNTACLLCD